MLEDIIAAFATPVGTSGLQVLRIAGPGSAAVADKIFNFGPLPEPGKTAKSSKRTVVGLDGYQAAFGYVHGLDKPNAAIDQCVITKFVQGKSYTGEEQVELSIHGGNALRKILLDLVLDAGARLAEPGEFTKWAFLNGKMDLSQAEAVMGLIEADTARQHKASLRHLQGETATSLNDAKDKVYELLSSLEVDIEYPEYEDFQLQSELIEENLGSVVGTLGDIVKNNKQGQVLRDGLQLALVGEPNVGKSSLLNALSGEDRAIVTNIAGTTRDSIELRVELEGLPVTMYDTAGIRETDDPIEKLGVERSKKILNESDLLLFVVNAINKEQIQTDIEQFIKMSAIGNDFIIVFNKLDLTPDLPSQLEEWDYLKNLEENPQYKGNIWVSATEGQGVSELKYLIVEYYENMSGSGSSDLILTSARQQKLIVDALSVFNLVSQDKDALPNDILAAGLKQGLELLGEITGENVSENMLDDIFSRFCIGK